MLRAIDEPKNGLRDFINSSQAPAIVVILAGTNDLAYIGEAKPVAECIASLHKLCWDCGVPRTVAVGIPPSAYQENFLDVADLCCEVNEALKAFCQSNPMANYVPFPFSYDRDDRWAPDGLHLTEGGYSLLGSQLAPAIANVLKSK
jgi:lysophospholipase L1-like esterase